MPSFPLHVALILSMLTLMVVAQTPVPPSTFPAAPSSSPIPSPSPAPASSVTQASTNISSVPTGTDSSTISYPSLGPYPPCVTNCLSLAVSAANCSTVTDVACFCPTKNFAAQLTTCVSSNCSSELSNAQSLAQQFCNVAIPSPTTSLSFPPVPSASGNSTNSTTQSTSSSPSPSSSPANDALTRPNPIPAIGSLIAVLFAYHFLGDI